MTRDAEFPEAPSEDRAPRLLGAFERTKDAIMLLDEELRIIDINPAMEALIRTKREALIGESMFVLRRDEPSFGIGRTRKLDDEIAAAMRENRDIEFEEYFPTTGRWVEIRIFRETEGLSVHAHDITKRVETELNLRKQIAMNASIFSTLLDAYIVMDAQGGIREFNEAAERIFGYTRDEALGRDMADLIIPPAYRDRHRAGLAHFRETGEGPLFGRRLEITAMRRSGEEFPVELAITPIADETMLFAGFIRDISERKHAEEQAAFFARANDFFMRDLDSERRIEMLAEMAVPRYADYCIIDVVEDGVVRRAAVRHADPGKEPLIRAIESNYPFEPSPDRGSGRVIRTGEAEHFPEIDPALIDAAAKDDEHRRLLRQLTLRSAMIVPLRAHGETIGAITFLSDGDRRFTERDLACAQDFADRTAFALDNALLFRRVQRALDEAKRANDVKDQFLATLTHELRTPLTAILGWAKMLRDGELDADTRLLAINTIVDSASTQARIIDDALDMTRIMSGKLELESKLIDIPKTAQETVDMLRPEATKKRLLYTYRIGDVDGRVLGDPRGVRQILWNLLANAIKFTPDQGEVLIRVGMEGGSALITVRDSGRGIDPAFLPHVFEPYRQEDGSTTRTHGGLGLGLAIVQRLVKAMGGTIEALSEGRGKGATFVVRLPLVAARDLDDTSRTNSTIPRTLANRRILLVDDQETNRNYLGFILSRAGAVVAIASGGAEALALARNDPPELLLTDIAMPEMDGLALLAEFRTFSAAPAVAVTAYGRPEDAARYLEAGFADVLKKPVTDNAAFVNTITRMLST